MNIAFFPFVPLIPIVSLFLGWAYLITVISRNRFITF